MEYQCPYSDPCVVLFGKQKNQRFSSGKSFSSRGTPEVIRKLEK